MAEAETAPLGPPRRRVALPIEVTAITAILALALATLAGAGAAVYQKSSPSTYLSSTVMLIDQPVAVAQAPDDGPLLKLQELRYYYSDLVNTQAIADPVGRQLNLPAVVIEANVAVAISPTTFTMDLVARGKTPAQSDSIAQATTAQLISYVAKQQAQLGSAPTNRVVLVEVSQPRAGIRLQVATRKIVIAGAVAFLVVGAAFLIVADLLRRRW